MMFFPIFLSIVFGVLLGGVIHSLVKYLVRDEAIKSGPCSEAATLVMALLCSPCVFLLTTLVIASQYQLGVMLFFSLLLVASFTDLQTLLISRFTSLFLVPICWLCAWFGFIPLSLKLSVIGSVLGYGLLSSVAFLFSVITKKKGLGQGDSDLLALIGAFTGPVGVWFSVLYGSIIGSLIGIALLLVHKVSRSTPLPFAPFLTIGVFVYLFYQPLLACVVMPGHLVLP